MKDCNFDKSLKPDMETTPKAIQFAHTTVSPPQKKMALCAIHFHHDSPEKLATRRLGHAIHKANAAAQALIVRHLSRHVLLDVILSEAFGTLTLDHVCTRQLARLLIKDGDNDHF